MSRTRLAWLAALLLTIPAAAAAVSGQAAEPSARATYEIRVRDHVIGTETIETESSTDSLRVNSSSLQLLGSAGRDSMIKQTKTVATLEDLDLRGYASASRFQHQSLDRGVECEDTLIHISTFANGRGITDYVVRPPGRLFVVDAGSFVAFDLICRMLHGRSFAKRPVNILVLGPRDTVVTATVEDGGTQTLRWGNGPVTVRRVLVSAGGESSSRYELCMDSEGRMLRLENAWSGTQVVRRPPPARSVGAKQKPKGP